MYSSEGLPPLSSFPRRMLPFLLLTTRSFLSPPTCSLIQPAPEHTPLSGSGLFFSHPPPPRWKRDLIRSSNLASRTSTDPCSSGLYFSFLVQYLSHHAPKGYAGTSRKQKRGPCVIPNPPNPNASLIASSHAHHTAPQHMPQMPHSSPPKDTCKIFHHINYYAVLIPARPPAHPSPLPPHHPHSPKNNRLLLFIYARPHAMPPCLPRRLLITQSHIPLRPPPPKNAAHAC